MRRIPTVVLVAVPAVVAAVAVLLVARARDGDGPPVASEPVPVTSFVWTTTLDQGGVGYELTVGGAVGSSHAIYSLQVEPILGGGGAPGDDAVAALAASAVNGFADDGVQTSVGPVDPDGQTEVVVLGDDRWYRNPWLLDEAADPLDGASWVRVGRGDAVLADVATAVLNERYDVAVRDLLDAVAAGRPVQAPAPDERSAELDEVLTPWIGLRGPAYPVGAEASVTGDVERGRVSWQDELTVAEDGIDAVMAGTVEWGATTLARPVEPGPSVDVDRVVAALG